MDLVQVHLVEPVEPAADAVYVATHCIGPGWMEGAREGPTYNQCVHLWMRLSCHTSEYSHWRGIGRSGELSGELSEGTPAALSGSLEGVVQDGSGANTGECSSPVELFSTDVAHLPLGERAVALRSQGSGLLCGDHAGNPPWELDPTQVGEEELKHRSCAVRASCMYCACT